MLYLPTFFQTRPGQRCSEYAVEALGQGERWTRRVIHRHRWTMRDDIHTWAHALGFRSCGECSALTSLTAAILAYMPKASDMSDELGSSACFRLAAPSQVLGKADMSMSRRLCEASKAWLRQRAVQWVRRRTTEPILQQSSADGTPINTMRRFAGALGHLSVVRHGRQTAEYLVQRVFLMGCDMRPIPIFRDPPEMATKTAAAHMKAGLDLFPCAREIGHEGLLVEHKVYDRAVMSAMKKLWDRWAAAHLHHTTEMHGEAKAHKLWLYHWRSIVGCFGHDCHGGLRWGIFRHLQSKQTVRDAYIGIESLRNGYDVIIKNLRGWIERHLHYEDSAMDLADRSAMWNMLGLEGEWLDIILDLQLRFEGDHLKVGLQHQGDPDLLNRIEVSILHLFKYRRFTDSRWVTLGSTGRSAVASMIVGVSSLVDYCVADSKSSSYYVQGWQRVGEDCKALFGAVAMSSFVADSALQLILDDGRLPRILGDVDRDLMAQVEFVCGMSPAVWSCVARACGLNERTLVDDSIMSAVTQAAYIHYKTKPAREYPYKLNRGDKLSNLSELKAMPDRPSEETTGKIWELLQRGVPAEDLLPGLDLLDQVDWSGTPVEQGHVKASRLMRKHPGYASDSMQCRAQVATMTAMLSKSAADAQCAKLEKQIERKANYSAAHFGGRQLFLRTLNEVAGDSAARGRDWGKSSLQKRVMSAHAPLWRGLPVDERDRYEKLAAYEREKQVDALDQQLFSLRNKLGETMRDDATAHSAGSAILLRLSACRFTDNEVDDFNSFCSAEVWTNAKVAARRAIAARPIGGLDENTQAALDSMLIGPDRPLWRPPWLAVVARHRALLRGSIFKVVKHDIAHYLCFVYASQNPLLGCFSVVKRADASTPRFSLADWPKVSSDMWSHVFAIGAPDFVYTDDKEFWDYHYLLVLKGCVAISGGMVCSDDDFVQIGALLEELEPFAHGKLDPVAEDAKQPERANTWFQDPALLNFWECPSLVDEGVVATSSKKRKRDEVGENTAPVGDTCHIDVEALVEELYNRRLELDERTAGQHDVPQFEWVLRGGAWTASKKGVAYDCVMTRPKPGLATRMMEHYSLQKTCSFAISKYSDELARDLAQCWVDLHCFFLEQWVGSGEDPSFDLRQAKRAFTESPAFGRVEGSGHSAAQKRLQSIRGIAPRAFAAAG